MSDQEIRDRIEKLKNERNNIEHHMDLLSNLKFEIDGSLNKADFNKQRNYLINTVKEFLKFEIDDKFIVAFLYAYSGSLSDIKYYLYPTDRNTLFERQLINIFATNNNIRYEDSLHILIEFLTEIKALDRKQLKINTSEKKEAKSKMDSGYDTNRIPLFI